METQWVKLKSRMYCGRLYQRLHFPFAQRTRNTSMAGDDHMLVMSSYKQHNCKKLLHCIIYSMGSFEMILTLRFIWSTEIKLNFTLQRAAVIWLCPYLHCLPNHSFTEWIYSVYSGGEIGWPITQYPVAGLTHS